MKLRYSFKPGIILVLVLSSLIISGCLSLLRPRLPHPGILVAPNPIMDNSGKHMCPYTQDDVLAEWVDMAVKTKIGSFLGKALGALAGQTLSKKKTVAGGIEGSKLGEKIGRAIAIKAAGGWDHIKNTSDISFNNLNDMAIYMYVHYSSNEHYQDALDAAWEIYPDLRKKYYSAIRRAPRK